MSRPHRRFKPSPRPRSTTAPRRLSALIVNYNSGAFALRCVESLQVEWERAGGCPSDLEIVVVDNASPLDQRNFLALLAARGVRVVASAVNGGYASGLNLALQHTHGAAHDVVALLNPDLCFLSGSIAPLLDHLEAHPACGAVMPRAFIDEECALMLPRNAPPSPLEHLRTHLAAMSPIFGRAYARSRLAESLEWWTADQPIEAPMLSGACLFMRRAAIAELGGLMDERYPLYYEDADLCRRLRALSFTLALLPQSRILHHWSRSAGAGGGSTGDPLRRYTKSRRAFVEKHFGAPGLALEFLGNRLFEGWPPPRRFRPLHEHRDLGATDAPITIALPRAARFVLQIAMSPAFVLAAGVLGEGQRYTFGVRTWSWLFPGRYFVRAFERETLQLLGAWRFDKTSPSRDARSALDAQPDAESRELSA